MLLSKLLVSWRNRIVSTLASSPHPKSHRITTAFAFNIGIWLPKFVFYLPDILRFASFFAFFCEVFEGLI